MIGATLSGSDTMRPAIALPALLLCGCVYGPELAVLPESFNRPMAVPVGIALIGLGVSLWRD